MKRKEMRKNRFWAISMILVLLVGQLAAAAPAAKAETTDNAADLRIIFTTDLHGQVVDIDYSKGALYPKGGLTKAATLIKEARSQVADGNSLLFDLGDVMYDYTTDYIYETDETATQPIYQAMASLNYDAIVLGNHDYEYTLPYIQKQYADTGLTDKVVVSNITDAITGKHIWNENKIIEKNLTTDSGEQVTVKVGVIGESIPTLSKKRCDYTGVLVGEDMVANVKKEAQLLKNQGADVIVVMAHSGIGDETPALMDENVGYALTQIPEVDVVLCGHKHTSFCADGTTKYDSYPGVDTETGLVNGKNLVMVASYGQGIGVVDLSVDQNKNIVQRKSQIRKVQTDTEIDTSIAAYMDKWGAVFLADSTEVLCELNSSSSTRWQNYLSTVEDSSPIQLLNDVAISYGLQYQNNENTDCKGLPVVAASRYSKYGGGSGSDYYDISGYFTSADLYQLINYRIQLWRYRVTGAQLKEWIEWSASAYETAGENVIPTTGSAVTTSAPLADTTPETSSSAGTGSSVTAQDTSSSQEQGNSTGIVNGILNYQGSRPIQYSLQETYLTDLSRFYVFDGLEYEIDTSIAPRYNYDGKKINETHRVVSVTRNGQEIKDTDEFLFIVNRLDSTTMPDQFVTDNLTKLSAADTRAFFKDYMGKKAECGTLGDLEDNNWSVSYSSDYRYILKTGSAASDLMQSKPWVSELLDSEGDFDYYLANLAAKSRQDSTGPNLNLMALNEAETNHNVTVAVQATDSSGIQSLTYLSGKYVSDSIAWNNASAVTDGYFACTKNGIYSVKAVDGKGNQTIRYIRINNINTGVLEAPKVDTYTNRKSYISGTAEPATTIVFELEDSTVYKSTVKDDGTFKYALPAQKAGTKIFVYVRDDDGRVSARTVVTVKRTGPNKPLLNVVTTAVRTLSGEINDTNAYPLFIVEEKKTIFMQDDGTKELFQQSELYDDKYKNYQIEYLTLTIASDGSFTTSLPYLLSAGTVVRMRTLDVAARNSMGSKRTVKQTVPAQPVLEEVTNLTTKIKVFSEEKCSSATVKVGKKKYTITKKKYISSKQMYRYVKKVSRTDSGVKVKAYLTNVKGDSAVVKLSKKEVVPDTPQLNKVAAGDKKITGHVDVVGDGTEEEGVTVENTKTKVFVYINGKKRKASVDFEGNFTLKLKTKLKSGTKIGVKARNKKGAGLKKTVKVK
jgi:2',3'-cyclic-nucleotide 2'-phosphodiesterase/3'-nucleotidase